MIALGVYKVLETKKPSPFWYINWLSPSNSGIFIVIYTVKDSSLHPTVIPSEFSICKYWLTSWLKYTSPSS